MVDISDANAARTMLKSAISALPAYKAWKAETGSNTAGLSYLDAQKLWMELSHMPLPADVDGYIKAVNKLRKASDMTPIKLAESGTSFTLDREMEAAAPSGNQAERRHREVMELLRKIMAILHEYGISQDTHKMESAFKSD